MNKDFVKIYDAIDKKQLREEKERITVLQENGLYPKTFEFPITLQFELTSHCNVFCKHCYNDSGVSNTSVDAMTPQRWLEFAEYLVGHGGVFECILSGGEPLLLRNDLFPIMDVLHNDGTSFLLITNGYLLTKSTVEKLSKYRYHWLQVSIDGASPEYHDSFRQRAGSWERATKGAFMVSAAGIPLTIAHCVTPYNLDQIDEMCDLAYSLGASSIMLGEINLSGRSSQNRDLLLNEYQKNKFYQSYEKNYAKYQGKLLVQRSASVRNSFERYVGTPNAGLIVRPNGDMRLDCMAPFIIGNIIKDDFAEVWKNKRDICWFDEQVQSYISSFNSNDENILFTNYVDRDIFI